MQNIPGTKKLAAIAGVDAALAAAVVIAVRDVIFVDRARKGKVAKAARVRKVSVDRVLGADLALKAANGAVAVAASVGVMIAAEDSVAVLKNGANCRRFPRSTSILFPKKKVSNRSRAKSN